MTSSIDLENKVKNLEKILSEVTQKLNDQNFKNSRKIMEFEYIYQVNQIISTHKNLHEAYKQFLKMTSDLVWSDMSYCFLYNKTNIEQIEQLQILENDDLEVMPVDENILMEVDLKQNFINIKNTIKGLDTNTYIFPLHLNKDQKFIFVFCFSKKYELPEDIINLIINGLAVIKNLISKRNIRMKLYNNYKQIKLMKNQLIHAEKMASIGTLSAGIAHEINNPLSFVLTNINVLVEYHKKILNNLIQNEELNYIIQDLPMLMEETMMRYLRILI